MTQMELGAQYAIYYPADSKNDWRYGDSLKVTGGSSAMGPLTSWLRLAYNATGSIGARPEIKNFLTQNEVWRPHA
jgi:hypothetical protein